MSVEVTSLSLIHNNRKQKPMKLQSKTSAAFPKFNEIGDKVEGTFVSWEPDVAGRFGPENILTLQGGEGETLTVRCPKVLSDILTDNVEHLIKGRMLTAMFTATKPSTKGNPLKLFDVELGEIPEAPDANEEVPF